MATVGELIVNLKANTAAIQSDLKKAEGMFAGFGVSTEQTLAKVGQLAAGMALSVGASMLYLGKQAIDAADHIFDLSQKTGLSAEFLSSVGHIARQSGTDLDSLAAAATKMSKTAVEAASGSAEQALTYRALGVAVRDAQGHMRSAEQLFVDVTRSLSQMGSGTTVTALAMRVFGKSGAEMLPFIQAFGGDIDKAKAKAQELGILVSTDMAKRADQWNDSLENMSGMVKGFGNDVAWTIMVIADYVKNIKGMFGVDLNRGLVEHTALEEAAMKAMAAANTKRAEGILLGEKAATAAAAVAKKLAAEAEAAAERLQKIFFMVSNDQKLGKIEGLDQLTEKVRKAGIEMQRTESEAAALGLAMQLQPQIIADWDKLGGIAANTVVRLKKPLTELDDAMRKFGQQTGDAFRTAMLHGRGFGDILKSLLVDLSQLILKMMFANSIKGMVSKGGGWGFLGSLLTGLLGFAGGGDFMAGQAIRVGEQGPEVAVFNQPGTIIPHGALAGAGGGVVQNLYIDARGAELGTVARLNAMMMKYGFQQYTAWLADQRGRTP